MGKTDLHGFATLCHTLSHQLKLNLHVGFCNLNVFPDVQVYLNTGKNCREENKRTNKPTAHNYWGLHSMLGRVLSVCLHSVYFGLCEPFGRFCFLFVFS